MIEPQKVVLKRGLGKATSQLAGTQKIINHVASWMVKNNGDVGKQLGDLLKTDFLKQEGLLTSCMFWVGNISPTIPTLISVPFIWLCISLNVKALKNGPQGGDGC